jgi:NAD(P)-dependent dehydrogenase (short-subunit alcohol dehydrogenase family)
MGTSITGRRVLVVGASSGMGWAIGVGLGKAGARVALAARRKDKIDEAVAAAGDGAIGVPGDVRDEGSCESMVAAAASAFGGLDAIVYCPGVSRLVMLADADRETWTETLTTNLVGAALVTRHALPHLEASHGRAVYLSSESVLSTDPWPGIGPYVVSKAALDKLIDALRVEHPSVAFTRFVVGACAGEPGHTTEFSNAWDRELFDRLVAQWLQRGNLKPSVIDPPDIVASLVGILESGADLETVVIRPRL